MSSPEVFCRPFIESLELPADKIFMYSDASGKIGYRALCNTSWMWGQWPESFLEEEPSIEFLELFGLVAEVLVWIRHFANRKVRLFCDNMSVVQMVNNDSSHCHNCMILIRLLVLESLKWNTRVSAKYVDTKSNGLADSLSRMDFRRFRKLGLQIENNATDIPSEIWPVWKVWTGKTK